VSSSDLNLITEESLLANENKTELVIKRETTLAWLLPYGGKLGIRNVIKATWTFNM